MSLNLKEQILHYGLGETLYSFAFIYKFAKTSVINPILGEDNKKIIESLENYRGENKELDLAMQSITNVDSNTITEIFKLFSEMSLEEISQIALWDVDNSMYNMSTPDSLSELAIRILEHNNDGKNIIDLGSYTGGFLTKYASYYDNYNYNGMDIYYKYNNVAKLRLALLGANSKFIDADMFKCTPEHKYNKIFINSPFVSKPSFPMIDLINNTNEINAKFTSSVSSDWFFVEKAHEFLKDGGRAVAIILNSSLSKMTDSYIREQIIKSGMIEAIITLPSKVFPYSGISSSMIVLSNNNDSVKYIDASNLFIAERRMNLLDVNKIFDLYSSNTDSDFVKIISNSKFEKYDYSLSSNYYFDSFKMDLINPTKLSDVITEIFRGYQISAREMDEYIVDDNDYSYKVLNLSNINNGIIDYDLSAIKIQNDKLDRYLVKDGDIIISAKSSKIKVGLVTIDENEKIIASGNLLVVRPDKTKINPAYLKMFLESEKGTKILNMIQTGTVILSINPSQLREIEISLLPIEEQDRLANIYLAKIDAIELAKRKVQQLEKELKNISIENI